MGLCGSWVSDCIGFVQVTISSGHIIIPVTGILIVPTGELAAAVVGPVVFGADVGRFIFWMIQVSISKLCAGITPVS